MNISDQDATSDKPQLDEAGQADLQLDEPQLDEPRIIVETGVEGKIAQVIEPLCLAVGYRLVRVRLLVGDSNTLQILAERPDGTMLIDDCVSLSRAISLAPELDNMIDASYNLEVSSPGISRPLARRSDFVKWAGFAVKIETPKREEKKQYRFRGTLLGIEGDEILMELATQDDVPQVARIDISTIERASLIDDFSHA